MKLLSLIGRAFFLVAFCVVVWAVYFYDAAREAAQKRKLGAAYEGPADNSDLP